MEHQGWKIVVKYGEESVWRDYWTPDGFKSKKSLESIVRQSLSSGKYGRMFKVVEKFHKEGGEQQ